MVVSSATPIRSKKMKGAGIPTVDLSMDRSKLSELVVKACEEYGFFKVVSHGVPNEVVHRLEEEGVGFFSQSAIDKNRPGAPSPFGYGCRKIGLNGDVGELEYLLLHPLRISEISSAISNDPLKFSSAVTDYVEAVKELAGEVLDLVCEGLWAADKSAFSNLITDANSDSLLRINHYPPSLTDVKKYGPLSDHHQYQSPNTSRIGFGEHSDPQIVTVLRSNDVEGLQICLQDGLWVPVPADPTAFYIMVGDLLQALTNGRFKSVRHRAMANSSKPRMSMVYFGAPPLDAKIFALPETILAHEQALYKPFTWEEFKKVVYSCRLADSRLHVFQSQHHLQKK